MDALKINGVVMPAPDTDSYALDLQDLDSENTGRGEETGIMFRERIRTNVRKLSPKWSVLTGAELKTITDAISAAEFTVTVLDPTAGSAQTLTMYAGDRHPAFILQGDTIATSLFTFSVSLTEV